MSVASLVEPIKLERLLDVEAFREVCRSFTQLYAIGIHVVSEEGRNIADIRGNTGEYYDYLFTVHATKVLYTDLVNYLKTAELSEDGSIETVDCFSGLRYQLMPIVHDGSVLGKVIFGPYAPQGLSEPPRTLSKYEPELDLGTLAEHLKKIPRASDKVVKRVLDNIRRVLDVIIYTSYKTHLTSQMHIASISAAFEDLEKTNGSLREANERLHELDRLKSNFISTVSHELRTPLTSIIGYAEMLIEGLAGEMPDSQTKYVRTILEKGESLLLLIGQVLDLSRIESGNVVLHKEEVDPRFILDKCVSDVLPQANKRSLEIAIEVSEEVRRIVIDPDKIRRVITNLLSNAVKFSDESTTIRLTAGLTQEAPNGGGKFDVFEPERNDYLLVEVTDCGIGIPPDCLERIFDSFYQVDNSSTREFEGTGLGLAIVMNFVRAHEGQVAVRSEVGQGSTFSIRIPYAQEAIEIAVGG